MSAKKVLELKAVMDQLPARDKSFAASLIQHAEKRDLSDKQMNWVEILIGRGNGASGAGIVIDNVKGIIDLINRHNKAKWPKIRILSKNGTIYQLSKAGDKSKFQGSLNIKRLEQAAALDRGSYVKTWLGRIQPNGDLHLPYATGPTDVGLTEALVNLSEDPAKVAAEYGKKMGHCCFCEIPLDDPRSLEVGYGPVCAKNYKLVWGNQANG